MTRRAIAVTITIFMLLSHAVGLVSASTLTEIHFSGRQPTRTMTSPVGGVTSSPGEEIDTVNGIAIAGGLLQFTSPEALTTTFFPGGYSNFYGPGGAFTLTGSVFGLPAGSLLLSGSFGASEGRRHDVGYVQFLPGSFIFDYLDPTVAAHFSPFGFRPVSFTVVEGFPLELGTFTDITLVSSEPAADLAVGLGALLVAVVFWTRRRPRPAYRVR